MGIFFSLLAAVFFSLSHITLRRGVTKLGVSSGTIIMLLSGTFAAFVIALIVEGVDILWPINSASIIYFALGGLIHFLGGWGFQNASASRIGPTRLSMMTGSTPLFAAILAYLSLSQSLNIFIVLGIALIFFGIALITLGGNNE
jgi:drug/metabolite transporter (DMT)-like permease